MPRMQVALFFADGRAYFFGIGLVLVALILFAVRARRIVGSLARAVLIVGVVVIVLSSTPAPIWFCSLWALVTLIWVILAKRADLNRAVKAGALVAVIGSACVAAGMELRYHRLPRLEGAGLATTYVIGDSLSAGVGIHEMTWPRALGALHSLDVEDLSRAGATLQSAILQARQVKPGAATVLLEIGGNDLLGKTTTGEFEADLRRLIVAIRDPSRQVLLFELPLPPFAHAYGSIQRKVAAEYGIRLIPKRVLAGIIASRDGTLDGLHLSEAGHARVAETVWGIIRPAESGK